MGRRPLSHIRSGQLQQYGAVAAGHRHRAKRNRCNCCVFEHKDDIFVVHAMVEHELDRFCCTDLLHKLIFPGVVGLSLRFIVAVGSAGVSLRVCHVWFCTRTWSALGGLFVRLAPLARRLGAGLRFFVVALLAFKVAFRNSHLHL